MEVELNYDPKLKRLYLKEDVAKVIGETNDKIKCLANFKTVLLYGPQTDYESVLNSLEVIKMDLLNRKKEHEKNDEDGRRLNANTNPDESAGSTN